MSFDLVRLVWSIKLYCRRTSDSYTIGNLVFPINDTNLAVKSIIALKAYADMLNTLGQDGSVYSSAATTYASSWQNLASTSTGYAGSYGDGNSWSLIYNIFADKWLKTGLFPDTVFQRLSSQYATHNSESYNLFKSIDTDLHDRQIRSAFE